MKCNNCDYSTENPKSLSNHIRNGCQGNKPDKLSGFFNLKRFVDRGYIPKRPVTNRSELSRLTNYEDRRKLMGWKDCLASQEILSRYINGQWK